MKVLVILALLGSAAACDSGKPSLAPPTGDLGTGLNTIDRKYPKPVPETLKAASAAVSAFELRIETEKNDALGGEIVARRATGDKVVVTVKSVESALTSVSIRVGPGDRNMANLIHEKIAVLLGLGESAAAGESATGLYSADLAACTTAGERAFRARKMEIVGRQSGEGWSELRARGEDAVPASFRFKKEDDGRTEVTICCGTAKGPAARESCDQLKVEFEKALAPARGN